MSEILRCENCTDEIVVDGDGCDKCNNKQCGYCCEFDNVTLCGDCLVPLDDCGHTL